MSRGESAEEKRGGAENKCKEEDESIMDLRGELGQESESEESHNKEGEGTARSTPVC